MLKSFEKDLLEQDWTQVEEGIEVKLRPGPDGDETFILCRSTARREKEKAMHERFEKRIEEGLQSLERRLDKAKKKPNRSQVERQIVLLQSELKNPAVCVTPIGDARRRSIRCRNNDGISVGLKRLRFCGST